MAISIVSEMERLGQKYSLERWGTCRLESSISLEFYRSWLAEGLHADLGYLEDHLKYKEEPKKFWPQAHSAIVVTQAYHPFPETQGSTKSSNLRLALYAGGEDYHFWFRAKLKSLAEELQLSFPQQSFLPLVDSYPVLERDLAYRAGIGWFGKNSCIINRQDGSLFFIGEIYTDLDLEGPTAELSPDFCGTCNRCIEICPTKALVAPKKLDANRCISYWTIESRKIAPVELRSQFGDWFFGCDLCQTICPWNQKKFKDQLLTTLHQEEVNRQALIEDLREILSSSGKQLEKKWAGTPLKRAGPFGLKRNALYVIGNKGLSELKPEVEKMLNSEKLRELAVWTLKKINPGPAF